MATLHSSLDTIEKIRAASRTMVREWGFLSDMTTACGTSPSECHTLVELDQRGQLTLSELSTILRLDKSTLSRVVDRLKKKKMIRPAVSTCRDSRL
jgi:DNA-binding MarR family transcriptional regulator